MTCGIDFLQTVFRASRRGAWGLGALVALLASAGCERIPRSAAPAPQPEPSPQAVALPEQSVPGPAQLSPDRVWQFPSSGVTFRADFPGARLSECEAVTEDTYGLVIRPENLPVNDSPWFAFQLQSEAVRRIRVRLRVQGGSLRYRPKVSLDGDRWIPLPDECYTESGDGKEALLMLESGPEPLWVAAQELVSGVKIKAWAEALDRLPFVSRSEVGRTVSGKRLLRLDLGRLDSPRKVVLLGRLHPPEVTGTLALMRFVEEMVGDSDQARAFRDAFHVVVFPLVNPDGVDAGHWRHNLGRVDLNRDWQAFQQPETRSVRDEIRRLTGKSARLRLWLDFHSTFKDVFYTQTEDQATTPPDFTRRWLEAIKAAVPSYSPKQEASPVPTPTTSTFWAYQQFGCPAITYEIGDHTDRALLLQVAAAACREMMRLLLEFDNAE